MPRTAHPEPTAAQISAAERQLARVRDALPADLWARLVRCKAVAAAHMAQRRAALAQPVTTPLPARPIKPRQAGLWDARRAAANAAVSGPQRPAQEVEDGTE